MAGRLGRQLRRVAGWAARFGPVADSSDRGATATEYAMLVGFIAVIIAISIAFFGSSLSDYYQNIATSLGHWL